ncbi:MAG: diaminopimelate epimerase [Chloroflexi bacterium]|jgi:diaminopimelate epimerase|nr:diaminopimelate epimerase [Chloroflexota bacterium]MDP7588921.1 diaminopimelate epimerase [Dehalococcoidia bacterium]MQF89985.1 diaminopimelate epimerase [SAR202 cluster bacterium]|tara:strand:- start:580 stop:1431 length:852 start_codon:yes stop_codon:yes gene_type:complete
MKFTKMHGAGNDYVYVDARSEDRDWPELSRQMSDRHFGVGGDGLILIKNSDVADLRMSMFNADGSEAEMCGNGIRCFVKYAVDRGIVSDSVASISVETLAGIRQIATITEGDQVTGARVSMGTPILTPKDVPVKLESAGEYGSGPVLGYPFQMEGHDLPLSFVSMGNPHAVTFIDTPVAEFPLLTVGPKVEHHAIFPNRVNFEIVNVNSRDHLTARVWERGSGETLACGTGACGIAVASILGGHTGNTVDITLPGGTLKVDWDGQGEVFLEGPAEEVFSGEWT